MEKLLPELVYQYEFSLLDKFVKILKDYNYSTVQFVPTRKSKLAFVKEHENLLNLFCYKKHLLFYYSISPSVYQYFITKGNKKLNTCFRACFFNEWISKKEIEMCFGKELTQKALENQVLICKNNEVQFTLSFVPCGDYILLRDPFYTYPPYANGAARFKGRIWMGADSIMFATFLKEVLKDKRFDAAIEVGSGSGIQIITASPFARKCVAIDYNNRAVQFTKINARLNGIHHLEAYYSDLFENVSGQFDLVLANPWYCDLETGALEEVPGIIKGLRKHLREDGICVMILNSYVKNNQDTVYNFLYDFIKQEKYDLDIYTIGYNIDKNRFSELKKHGITHNIMYYTILKNNGKGIIQAHNCSFLRKIRDFTYISAIRMIYKRKEKRF